MYEPLIFRTLAESVGMNFVRGAELDFSGQKSVLLSGLDGRRHLKTRRFV
jgi:hypothetical protein